MMTTAVWLRIATLCVVALLTVIAIETHRIAEALNQPEETE